MDIFEVSISKPAEKQLKKLPAHIVLKLQLWIDDVRTRGLMAVRIVPGFHDEPLKGERRGQRSIRLNKAYRAIYVIDSGGCTHIAEIMEVSKHEY